MCDGPCDLPRVPLPDPRDQEVPERRPQVISRRQPPVLACGRVVHVGRPRVDDGLALEIGRKGDARVGEGAPDMVGELPKGKEVLIYCANGIRAEMAHETLSRAGIRNRYLNETVTIAKDGNFKI